MLSLCVYYDLYGETSPIFSPSLVRGKQIYIQPITEGFSNDMDKLAQNGSPGKKEKDPKRSELPSKFFYSIKLKL